jgi:O-antigen ligase
LALSLQWTWVTGPFDYLNRYQDLDEMMSLTGRSEIWLHALSRVVEGWIPLILGHGYGVSRFVINEGHQVPSFFASHAHNALIEVVLTTGILGLIPFVTMVAYSGRWLTRFRELGERYSHHFVLRAICTTLIIWVSSLTESHLGMKIGPIAMIYFFYVVALDRRKDFELTDVVSSQGERTGGGNVQELCPRDGSPKRGKKHHGNDTLGGRADAFTREMGHRERRFG